MIKAPTKFTLRKYGLTEELWYNLLNKQDGICPICLRVFDEDLRPCIDHNHVRNFKKMKPEQKRKHVRGLLCLYDNQRVVGRVSEEKAYRTYLYLHEYNKRCNE